MKSNIQFYVHVSESGFLEFEEFVTLAGKFMDETDEAEMEKELREAFRLYDKEGKNIIQIH